MQTSVGKVNKFCFNHARGDTCRTSKYLQTKIGRRLTECDVRPPHVIQFAHHMLDLSCLRVSSDAGGVCHTMSPCFDLCMVSLSSAQIFCSPSMSRLACFGSPTSAASRPCPFALPSLCLLGTKQNESEKIVKLKLIKHEFIFLYQRQQL